MTAIDPHRTLGLAPGATQAEVKRAYRRLAKAFHPDAAGDRTLQRFLAIQAAYETLVDGGSGGSPGRAETGAGPRPPGGAAPPPWQADPGRARATREAHRGRTRRPAGSDPGGAPGGRPEGSGSSSGDRAGSRDRRWPKATIGSTSYDGADREPFDPTWDGATWYGAGSGTYWTINPKEYADPRKHGPEYLARSRRRPQRAAGPAEAWDGAFEPPVEGPDVRTTGAPAAPGDGPDAPRATSEPQGERAPTPDPRAEAQRAGAGSLEAEAEAEALGRPWSHRRFDDTLGRIRDALVRRRSILPGRRPRLW